MGVPGISFQMGVRRLVRVILGVLDSLLRKSLGITDLNDLSEVEASAAFNLIKND